MYDFYSEFSSALNEGNISGANASLMKELSAILVRDKSDFVDMLNESGVDADVSMSDAELIQLFVDNASSNKKLILGAALLVNVHNTKMGFDGDEEIDDALVKQSYFTMKSCFVENPNGEEYSYFPIGLAVGAASKLLGKGVDAIEERKASKEKMREEARRRREEERKRAEEERKKRQQNMLIYGGVAIVGILVIGIVLLRKR
jgi:hypothetical protein